MAKNTAKAIKLIKDSLLEIPDIDADKGYSALMRVKENLKEALKGLEEQLLKKVAYEENKF